MLNTIFLCYHIVNVTITKTVFIGPFSNIIGYVKICNEVFIGCNATLRADESIPFYIGYKSNTEDGVILHK
ncbi:hypothetical protein FDC45_10050 [Clostridium botulinum]|uniref:Uncharacterized protein n=1 Tax=Clostridium botulinum TaxID=1491 RepID=A0A846J8V0_CLOBO|nr:hypothetical protein [Clostridium botulinum]NFJ09972.1 hypothetical protein [Clostridium botulinum]NFK15787.1 hypothetical protein [Clostridium botulinum]NFM94085.1 hypothetical protein [Clostridium botulinum]NFO17688.1 hypothetical protein [Clostridium botulinum]